MKFFGPHGRNVTIPYIKEIDKPALALTEDFSSANGSKQRDLTPGKLLQALPERNYIVSRQKIAGRNKTNIEKIPFKRKGFSKGVFFKFCFFSSEKGNLSDRLAERKRSAAQQARDLPTSGLSVSPIF